MAALHFLPPTGDSRSGRRSFDSKLISLFPLDEVTRSRTASPPAPLAIRKAPSAIVESIHPGPPQPFQTGSPKGRRRKTRPQSHKFFFSTCCACPPTRPPCPGEAPHPPPLPENSAKCTALQ